MQRMCIDSVSFMNDKETLDEMRVLYLPSKRMGSTISSYIIHVARDSQHIEHIHEK